MPLEKIIICDIDGTLADHRHRLKYISGVTTDWDAYYEDVDKDPPIIPVIKLIHAMHHVGHAIFYFTGRTERYRSKTAAWLYQHCCPDAPLFMRETGDYRPDYILKAEMFKQQISDPNRVLFAIEDRQRVCQMWRELGILCLQCANGEY